MSLVSVASSGVVAIASVVVTALSKRGDRLHASLLDFEKRAWESKSDVLLKTIAACSRLSRELDEANYRSGGRPVPFKSHVLAEIGLAAEVLKGDVEARIIAYGSPSTRESLIRLLSQLDEALVQTDEHSTNAIGERWAKEQAIDDQDFEEAGRRREREIVALRAAADALTVDLGQVVASATTIITAARNDIQESGDISVICQGDGTTCLPLAWDHLGVR